MPQSRLLQTSLNHFFSPERPTQNNQEVCVSTGSPSIPSDPRNQERARENAIYLDSSDDDLIITNYPASANKILDLSKEIGDDQDDNDNDNDEEEDGVHTTPIAKRRGRRILDDDEDEEDDIDRYDEDGDEETMIKASPISTRRRRKVFSDQDDENYGSDDVLQTVPGHSNKGKRKIFTLESDEDNDNDDKDATEREAPEAKRKRLLQSDSEGSDEDEKEDLEFLDANDVYEQRTRGRKKSQYSLALERLKDRKRSSFKGSKGPIDRFAKSQTVSLLSSNSSDSEDDFDDGSDSSDDGAQDEEDFVVDDDVIDGVKVTPTDTNASIMLQEQAELPAEFRAANTQKFSANFKVYFEYLVNLVHDRKFAKKGAQTAYFENAVEAVERRIRGYRESLVTSDAWLPRFKNALDRYPQWRDVGRTGFVCEGCRQNRPAKYSVSLAAEPEEARSKPREQTFALGSECHKRAEVYHKLVHFRAQMYEEVRKEAEKITAEMDAAGRRAGDLRLTEEILQVMRQNGFARMLYSRVQDLLSKARFYYMERGEKFYGQSSSSSSEDEDSDDYGSP